MTADAVITAPVGAQPESGGKLSRLGAVVLLFFHPKQKEKTTMENNDRALKALVATYLATMIGGGAIFLQQMSALRSDMQAQFIKLESRFDTKVDALEDKFDTKVDGLEDKLDTKVDGLRRDMNVLRLNMQRLFPNEIFWVPQSAEASPEKNPGAPTQ